MREILAASFLVVIAVGQAEVIAQRCDGPPASPCEYLFIDDFVKWGRTPNPDQAILLGPYLREYRDLLPRNEAPVKEFKSAKGWRVVVTRGFEKEYRFAGPIFYAYFVDPHGRIQLRFAGDLFLEDGRIGSLFGSPTELFVVTSRSEVGDSFVTAAWVLPSDGRPVKVMETSGLLISVAPGSTNTSAGLYIASPRSGGGPPPSVLWKWHEAEKQFVK
jgi:hypothetical protein